MTNPAISRRPTSCRCSVRAACSNTVDTPELQTSSTNGFLTTEESTCAYGTLPTNKWATYSVNPSSRCLKDTIIKIQTYPHPKFYGSKINNETIENEKVRKLNNLRDYYVSQIKELPPVHQTAAAMISNISRRAKAPNDPSFHYHNTIEIPRKTMEQSNGAKGESIFRPKFNSTANDDKEQVTYLNTGNASTNYNEKTQISWIDYLSDESKSNNMAKTYTVDRSRRSSKSNKSLQTMLTMENVAKISEMLEKINRNKTYCVVDKIDGSVTFRLTNSIASVSSSLLNSGYIIGVDENLRNRNLNVVQMKDGVRANIINWFFRLDEYTGCNVVTLQCAVRFLDELVVLCKDKLPYSAFTCGVACFWIASKLQSARVPGASAIARKCGGAFTPQHLVACERSVLAKLAFPSAPLLPANEVERLAQLWSLHKESGVIKVAHQMCCRALLHTHLASLPSMQLAAAALATALQLLKPQHPLIPRLQFIRSDEEGWSVSLERELERVCKRSSGVSDTYTASEWFKFKA